MIIDSSLERRGGEGLGCGWPQLVGVEGKLFGFHEEMKPHHQSTSPLSLSQHLVPHLSSVTA